MGIATFCVLMVSLLLVGVSSLFVMNIEILLDSIEDKNELVLFLKDSVTEEMVPEVQEQISSLPNIVYAKYYPKETALENYISQMKEYEEVFESLKEDNPLPDAFNIRIEDTSKMTSTVKALNAFDFTEKVKAPTEFAQILTRLRKVVFITSIALLTALIIVSLIMISNSTRASVYARRREINIMKYVGATNSFIRMPFFFEGLFTGFVSGIGAYVVTYYGYTALMDIITNNISFWEIIGVSEPLPFSQFQYTLLAIYLCIGAVIGALGSVISTTKHLQV
jgi:cell division transport system permease protein